MCLITCISSVWPILLIKKKKIVVNVINVILAQLIFVFSQQILLVMVITIVLFVDIAYVSALKVNINV